MLHTSHLLLGSNIGNCLQHLANARSLIDSTAGKITHTSSVYKTAAWGNTLQADFYNQVLLIATALAPEQLLETLLNIEVQMGRERVKRWESRIIDIDILYYGNLILETASLQLPHPHLHQRRFALVPLCEVSPAFIHPVLCQTNLSLLQACEDELPVEKL